MAKFKISHIFTNYGQILTSFSYKSKNFLQKSNLELNLADYDRHCCRKIAFGLNSLWWEGWDPIN